MKWNLSEYSLWKVKFVRNISYLKINEMEHFFHSDWIQWLWILMCHFFFHCRLVGWKSIQITNTVCTMTAIGIVNWKWKWVVFFHARAHMWKRKREKKRFLRSFIASLFHCSRLLKRTKQNSCRSEKKNMIRIYFYNLNCALLFISTAECWNNPFSNISQCNGGLYLIFVSIREHFDAYLNTEIRLFDMKISMTNGCFVLWNEQDNKIRVNIGLVCEEQKVSVCECVCVCYFVTILWCITIRYTEQSTWQTNKLCVIDSHM